MKNYIYVLIKGLIRTVCGAVLHSFIGTSMGGFDHMCWRK